MAGLATIARNLVENVGSDSDSLTEAINAQVIEFAQALSEKVGEQLAKKTEPVSWRQALVLEHHGITKKTAKTYTVGAFEDAMEMIDHAECEVDSWNEKTLKVKKGCPIRMAELRAEKE